MHWTCPRPTDRSPLRHAPKIFAPLILFAAINLPGTWTVNAAQAENLLHETRKKTAPVADGGNLVGHGGPVKSIRVNHDGTHALTASFDYAAMYWDLTKPKPAPKARLTDHDGPVNAVAFVNASGQAVSVSDDGAVRLWDLASQKVLHKFEGHQAKAFDVAVSPDGKWAVSASWDRSLRLWGLTDKTVGPVLTGHDGPVNAALFSSTGEHVYSGSYDGTIRMWRVDTGKAVRPIHKHGWGINVMRMLPGGTALLFGTLNGDVQILDLKSSEIVKLLVPHEGPVLALAVSHAHGLVATGGGDGVIRVWSIADWALLQEYKNPHGPVWSMAFSGDGKRVYYAGLDDFVISWQIDPRAEFEPVQSKFPRRFQQRGRMSLGEIQFARKCSVCHTLTPEDGNRAGPTLYKILGRKAGSLPGYPYSKGLRDSSIIWNEKTIARLFDEGPDIVTPGSKMPLQRIVDKEKRRALISFLKEATKERSQNGQTAVQNPK